MTKMCFALVVDNILDSNSFTDMIFKRTLYEVKLLNLSSEDDMSHD